MVQKLLLWNWKPHTNFTWPPCYFTFHKIMIMTEMYIPARSITTLCQLRPYTVTNITPSQLCAQPLLWYLFIYVRFTPLSVNSDNTAQNRPEIQDFWHVTLCPLVVTDIFDQHSFSIVKVRYSEINSAIISKPETGKDKKRSGNGLIWGTISEISLKWLTKTFRSQWPHCDSN